MRSRRKRSRRKRSRRRHSWTRRSRRRGGGRVDRGASGLKLDPHATHATHATDDNANRVRLNGRLIERDALRQTPAGIDVIAFRMLHESTRAEAGGMRERHQAQVVDPADPDEHELQPRILRREAGVRAESIEGGHSRGSVFLDPAGVDEERKLSPARLDARYGEGLGGGPVFGG